MQAATVTEINTMMRVARRRVMDLNMPDKMPATRAKLQAATVKSPASVVARERRKAQFALRIGGGCGGIDMLQGAEPWKCSVAQSGGRRLEPSPPEG